MIWRKLTTEQSEDYPTGYLLDYDCIKNQYKLIAIDLNRQKEFDVHPKAIQQIEFDRQFKNLDAEDATVTAGNINLCLS